jgi:hypothetical protein
MRKVLVVLLPTVGLLVLMIALVTTGCGSQAASSMGAPTTTAPSRPITTELRPGETRLENGHVQAIGYVIAAHAVGLQAGGGPFQLSFIPAEMVTEEEVAAGPSKVIHPSIDQSREVPYEISPTASITVSTLGDGGEQAITLEQFFSIWSPSPPKGGEHLADVPWLIERDENAEVVSITEQSAP